ncbi:MAG TPA: hypothetical protein VGP37_05270 [Candidatus Nanopelagicales bacterium]|nr:hypothetical protein [Candidatus Nanopelagicales bacterium]
MRSLEDRGIEVEWVVWSEHDPYKLHELIDLLIIRSTWDYTRRLVEFLAWIEASTAPICNSPALVRWNSDKRYLVELEAAGIPTVHTTVVQSADEQWSAPEGFGEFVVKPSVGSGSLGAQRFFKDALQEGREHARALLGSGHTVLVQPYLPSVDEGSETALVFLEGVFSHAVTKGPMLRREGPVEPVDGLYLAKKMDTRTASETQREVAARVLAALPYQDLLYTRVDLVDAPDGFPVLLEVEAVEPLLFFSFNPLAAEHLADAILNRVKRHSDPAPAAPAL